jgi:hypothetical protein
LTPLSIAVCGLVAGLLLPDFKDRTGIELPTPVIEYQPKENQGQLPKRDVVSKAGKAPANKLALYTYHSVFYTALLMCSNNLYCGCSHAVKMASPKSRRLSYPMSSSALQYARGLDVSERENERIPMYILGR